MKIVFFGTPEFAIPSLKQIEKSNHDLLMVVTNPDKQSGRGLAKTMSPVKIFCNENSINHLSIDNFDNEENIRKLNNIKADIFIVVAFKILPLEIINMPKYGSINIHPSILPKYRGSSPIQHALLNGDSKTGITIFKLDKNIDSGGIILQKEYKIYHNIIFSDLYLKLADFGAELLLQALELIVNKDVHCIKQRLKNISYAKKIHIQDCEIDWGASSMSINNKIRAFSNKPGAFTFYKGKKIKIFNTKILKNSNIQLKQSKCIYKNKSLLIGTRDFPIVVRNLQIEGKKIITAQDFNNSNFSKDKKYIYFE